VAKPSSSRPHLHPPSEARVQEILESLKTYGDSAAAILGAAYLDYGLRVALENKFPKSDKVGKAFDPPAGMLAVSSNKISLAHLLGIIGDKSENDLRCVFRIRNIFAHPFDTHDFDHGEIDKNIKKLQIIPDELQKGMVIDTDNNIMRFHLTVVYLFCGLTGGVFCDPHGFVLVQPGMALP
jgi:hypothetical protein